jgi:hypothetical protein
MLEIAGLIVIIVWFVQSARRAGMSALMSALLGSLAYLGTVIPLWLVYLVATSVFLDSAHFKSNWMLYGILGTFSATVLGVVVCVVAHRKLFKVRE